MPLATQVAELHANGFCLLKGHYPVPLLQACREAFWPTLLRHIGNHHDEPNRGPHRHFLPMPFQPPCFAPQFFFDAGVLAIVHTAMDESIVADQWGCDAPLQGSTHQAVHVDYQRPLFAEAPDLPLPTYLLVVSFGLIDITLAHGPVEIAPGTHRMRRTEAIQAVEAGRIKLHPVTMEIGDVLIRHPWALHRGTPNLTSTPRALLTVRYVRHWYADHSREVNAIPRHVWLSLAPEQRSLMRFPLQGIEQP